VDRYQVLGVPPTASYAEVRDRYRQLLQRFHPDRLHGEPPEVRPGAERKMQAVTEAWGIIESDRRSQQERSASERRQREQVEDVVKQALQETIEQVTQQRVEQQRTAWERTVLIIDRFRCLEIRWQ